MERCIIYCRVSTDGQKENYSLPEQEKMCLERAEERGYKVVGIVKDECSGAKIERPGMDKVLDLAHAREFEVLLVSDLDRFAREPEVKILLKRELTSYGVRIEYVLKDFSNDPTGELLEDILTAFASHERKVIRQRMMRGKKARLASGYVIGAGQPNYGYDYVSENHKGWYVINEREAEVVRYIFHLYVNEGLGHRAISTRLMKEGYAPRSGKYWSIALICRILTNEIYIGNYYFGKRKYRNGKRIFRDKSEWIRVEVPSIISEEMFNTAQELRQQRNAAHKRRHKFDYLLSGRLFCACCGSKMTGRAASSYYRRKDGVRSKYYYHEYRCKDSYNFGKFIPRTCKGGVPRKKIEKLVWDYIYSLISDTEAMAKAVADANRQREDARAKLENRRRIIEDEINKINRQRDRLLDTLLEDDAILSDAIKTKLQMLSEKQAGLMRQLETVKDNLKTKPAPMDLEAIMKLCEQLLSQELSIKGKQRILEILNVKVIVNKEQKVAHIHGTFPAISVDFVHSL